MEGISHEACSLAGTWQLGKLIAFWDDNGISIDGDVKGLVYRQHQATFFKLQLAGFGRLMAIIPEAIEQAIVSGTSKIQTQPTLICCKTTIGHGCTELWPIQQKFMVAQLVMPSVNKCVTILDWPHASFHVPDSIYELWDCQQTGRSNEAEDRLE